ncbi:hypothetical protein PC9H_005183 [Pleurotus ostreatus]|uniref:Uncharacterized protein n=1 Tax=Pleurotus ostreatus TaxID=5322 RepID=A0A8H7A093_PLEOS|nr:uncharacterized protein PC9H_005183 [Pleurotus ostreatus]KAF7433233.1 hypothetical protein PC9H_005183 [Pleurotus ostreatus]
MNYTRLQSAFHSTRLASQHAQQHTHRRRYATKTKSAHAQWYADVVPAMIPVALLGSAVYLALQLVQVNLAHEKHLDEAKARLSELETEVNALREERRQNLARASTSETRDSPNVGQVSHRWWPFS